MDTNGLETVVINTTSFSQATMDGTTIKVQRILNQNIPPLR